MDVRIKLSDLQCSIADKSDSKELYVFKLSLGVENCYVFLLIQIVIF